MNTNIFSIDYVCATKAADDKYVIHYAKFKKEIIGYDNLPQTAKEFMKKSVKHYHIIGDYFSFERR